MVCDDSFTPTSRGERGVSNHLPCIEKMIHKEEEQGFNQIPHPPSPFKEWAKEEENQGFVVCFSLTNSPKKKTIVPSITHYSIHQPYALHNPK